MNFGDKQEFSSTLYTGFALVDVVAVNPTKAELAAIKGYEVKAPEEGKEVKEFSYEGKTETGDEYVDVVFYLKCLNQEDKPIMPVRFRLVDKDVISKKEENGVETIKYQWVNQQGGSAWVDDKKNLLEKFTHVISSKGEDFGDRQYRLAIQGEANLYGFMQSWLDKGVAFFGENAVATDIFIDKKKMFRNIDKYVDSEIRPIMKSGKVGRFNALTVVNISEKDGKINHFQNVHNNFWPDWKFKDIQTAIATGNWTANDNTRRTHESLLKSLKKSAYTLGWIKEFTPDEHMNAGNSVLKTAEGSDDEAIDGTY